MNKQERRAVKQVIQRALVLGFSVSVWDREAYTVKRSRDAAAILAGMGGTDEDVLIIRYQNGLELGRISFVYGNEPDEVIADYSDNPVMRAIVGEEPEDEDVHSLGCWCDRCKGRETEEEETDEVTQA